MKPLAAIDVGTNTVLMVVGHCGTDGAIEILDDAHAIARMGRGVDKDGRIQDDRIDRVCQIVEGYHERAKAFGIERICAFGTSALRDATNKEAIISAVAERADVELVELSGADEAGLTFRGAAFSLELPSRFAVLDIGGGSTELAIGTESGGVEESNSVDVGAVRVTERFFGLLPPGRAEQEAAATMITEQLKRLPQVDTDAPLVGVAGTVTTLGAIDTQAASFDDDAINGHQLSIEAISDISADLLQMDYAQIRAISQINEQRADIITAGALILKQFLLHRGYAQLTVSTRGIRYGLLLDMIDGKR